MEWTSVAGFLGCSSKHIVSSPEVLNSSSAVASRSTEYSDVFTKNSLVDGVESSCTHRAENRLTRKNPALDTPPDKHALACWFAKAVRKLQPRPARDAEGEPACFLFRSIPNLFSPQKRPRFHPSQIPQCDTW